MSRQAARFLLSTLAVLTLATGLGFSQVSSQQPPASSFRFPAAKPQSSAPRPAPVELTASDGTGLRLVALEARGVLEPPLAFTELHLAFENPQDRTIEGRFRIALPPGAVISRFAMKIGAYWQEGEVVERQRARQAYEDFLHRRQDPALLEQETGNEFSARVFPIPARARKEIVVSYSHALMRADDPYVFPLQGLPEIDQLELRVLLGERPAAGAVSNLGGTVSDVRVAQLSKRAWKPDRDFEIAQDQLGDRTGLRHGNLTVVRVAAPVEATPQKIAGLYVLVDSSASRALGWKRQVQLATDLLTGLRDGSGGQATIGLAAFDQEVVPIFEGPASGFGDAAVSQLRARRPLGASDLQRALAELAERLAKADQRFPRVLLVTDGIATAGATDTAALKAAVHALAAHGVERLDVLAAGGLRDAAVLRELTTGNLAHDGATIDADQPIDEIARRLTLAVRSGIAVAVEGAAWVWPETLDGVQPGDEALVYSDLPEGRPLRLALDGRPVQLGELAAAERPLLERQWVAARIERLIHLRETAHAGDPDLRRALDLQVIELSTRHRVLSPLTAFLVLETAADYRRFGLDRTALADILTVGGTGLEVLARSTPPAPALARQPDIPKPMRKLVGRDDAGGEELRVMEVAPAEPGDAPTGIPATAPVAAPEPQVETPETDAPLRIAEPTESMAVDELILAQEAPPSARQMRRAAREEVKKLEVAPYEGRFAEVMTQLAAGKIAPARALTEGWLDNAPGDLLALVALGEVCEAERNPAEAARAYGSLIDLFPSRADLRRYAGERLERLGDAGLALAIDTYAKAAADRPDHPSVHHLLGWALVNAGRFEEAFAVFEKGLARSYPQGRFAGVRRILEEDLGLIAAGWLRAEPKRREEIFERLSARGVRLETQPSLRFVLSWESDANDVDLHVFDRHGGHAFYSERTLRSGGELYADVTTGYGPECFTVPLPRNRRAGPYRLAAHYYNRGPMGFGMGLLQVIEHDGEGGLRVEPRPFVVMVDQAMVELGSVGKP